MRKLLSALGVGLLFASASGVTGMIPASAASVTVDCTGVKAALTVNGNDITLDNGGVPCTNATTGGFPLVITTGQTVSLHGKTQQDGFDGEATYTILRGTDNGATMISNLTFKNAVVGKASGGAIGLGGTVSPTISNSIFLNNQATSGQAGGAVWSSGTGPATVTNNVFGSATAPNGGQDGGALYLDMSGADTVTGNTFIDNTASETSGFGGGGGALVSSGSTTSPAITFSNNTLTGNTSAGAGGGAFLQSNGGQVVLMGNTFSKNAINVSGTASSSNKGGGITIFVRSSTVPGTLVQSNNVFDSNKITVTPLVIPGVQANAAGPRSSSPDSYGGAGEFAVATSVNSLDDAYYSNTVDSSGSSSQPIGGGFALQGTTDFGGPTHKATLTAYNMVVTNNTVGVNGEGGGIYAGFNSGCQQTPCTAEVDLFDSTVSNNKIGTGTSSGPEMAGDVTDVAKLVNDIVTGPVDLQTDVAGFGTFTANHSDVCNAGAAVAGTGNICKDPKLANVAANDVHETSVSPSIDSGDSSQVPGSLTKDFYGVARVQGKAVDMGAAEVVFVAPVLPAAGSGPVAPVGIAWWLLALAAMGAAGATVALRRLSS